jgi:hypothetical protein
MAPISFGKTAVLSSNKAHEDDESKNAGAQGQEEQVFLTGVKLRDKFKKKRQVRSMPFVQYPLERPAETLSKSTPKHLLIHHIKTCYQRQRLREKNLLSVPRPRSP